MNPIASQLTELNLLCEMDDPLNGEARKTRIRQLFTEIVTLGYNIVTPRFDPESPEYAALSERGKLIRERVLYLRGKKKAAIDRKDFELAADLRELERTMKRDMVADFSQAVSGKFFVLLPADSKQIIYNDYDGKLNDYFKIT